MIGAAKQLVGDDLPRLCIDNWLHRARQASAQDQLVELGLVRRKKLRKAASRYYHRAHFVEGHYAVLLYLDQAQPEFGTGKVDDVVGLEQAITVDALPVDESAIGAVLVDEL